MEENSGEHIEKIIRDIYIQCDTDHCNSVSVPKLLEFISTGDTENIFDFSQVQDMLDPNRLHVNVNCEEFVNAVVEWACDNGLTNSNFNGLSKRFEFMNEVVLCETANSSMQTPLNCSADELNCDRAYIKELESKSKKLTEQLEDLKQQLVNSEELNDVLQAENDRVSSILLKVERGNKKLQQVSQTDDQAELISQYDKKVHQLSKSVTFQENRISSLNNVVKKQTEDRDKLEQKLKIFEKRLTEQTQLMCNLHTELDNKEKMILSLTESNSQLQSVLKTQDEDLAHYFEIVNILKTERKSLEGSISEYFVDFSYSNVLNNTPKKSLRRSLSVQTPLTNRILSDVFKFNSPNFLYCVQNPVSPGLGSPVNCINNNVGVEDSPNQGYDEDDNVFVEDGNRNVEMLNVSGVNGTYLENSLKTLFNNDHKESLSDEILIADQDFHRNECRNIIKKQKVQIEELEDEITKFKSYNVSLKEESKKFRLENEELLAKLSEETKRNDFLENKVSSNKKLRKYDNFNKMEIKLERKIEELYNMNQVQQELLKEKQILGEKLNTVMGDYNKLKTSVKTNFQYITVLKSMNSQLKNDVKHFIKMFNSLTAKLQQVLLNFNNQHAVRDMNFCIDYSSKVSEIEPSETTSQVTQLFEEIPYTSSFDENVEASVNSKLCTKFISALKIDTSTIDNRLQVQQMYLDQTEELLSDVFKNLIRMFTIIEPYLARDYNTLYMHQIEAAKKACSNYFKAATLYGGLIYEHHQLPSINAIITHTSNVQLIYQREINQYKEIGIRETKTVSWYRVLMCMLVFLIMLVCLRRCCNWSELFQMYIKKTYVHNPPT